MTEPIDTYRDAFLAFLKEGMTYAEAREQFDQKEWHQAVYAELDSEGLVRLDMESHELVTNDERGLLSLLALDARASFEARSAVGSRDMDQAMELWAAGWKSEVPNPEHNDKHGFWSQSQVMSFYWRRPPRRPGSLGMRFYSTQQAYNALKRD